MAFTNNEQFAAEFEDFVDASEANKDELNSSTADQTQGASLKLALKTQLNDLQAARSAYDAAAATFKETRRAAGLFQASRKKFYGANPAVSEALKAKLNIAKPSGTNANVFAQPLNLSAEGFANGINTLNWERNGNPPYRNFIVEYRIGDTGEWLIGGTTRKTTFNHKNQTPGTKIYYRVYAQTDEEQSPYSNFAVVYA